MTLSQWIPSCESTNSYLKSLLTYGLCDGDWIASYEQTQGRGRRENTWLSQDGNLHLSVYHSAISNEYLTWVPLLSAVSVIQAFEKLGSSLPIRIKWPNDLYFQARKVGGILCEASSLHGILSVVIGIGINLQSYHSDLPSTTVGSFFGHLPPGLTRESLANAIRVFLEFNLKQLNAGNLTAIRSCYEKWSLIKQGHEITWRESGLPFFGRMVRLGDHGELWVRDSKSSTARALLSEVVSLVRLNSAEDSTEAC